MAKIQSTEKRNNEFTLVERIGEKEENERRRRVSHIIVQTSVEKRPWSQFGAAKAEKNEARKGCSVSRGCITFRQPSFTTF